MISLKQQSPFSLYDFLGYTTPGAAFLLAIAKMGRVTAISKLLVSTGGLVYFVLAAYLCGHLLSFLSSLCVERYAIWRYGYPSRCLLRWGKKTVKKTRRRSALQGLVALVLLPVAILEWFVDWLFERAHYKQLDPLLSQDLRACVGELLGCDDNDVESRDDFFRSVYHFVLEHAPMHAPKLQNYVALYGFVRSVCLGAVILTWAAAVMLMPWCTVAGALISFLFFLAFLKFYRRFTLEGLMALQAMSLKQKWDLRHKPRESTEGESDSSERGRLQ